MSQNTLLTPPRVEDHWSCLPMGVYERVTLQTSSQPNASMSLANTELNLRILCSNKIFTTTNTNFHNKLLVLLCTI